MLSVAALLAIECLLTSAALLVQVKNMEQGSEETVSLSDLASHVAKLVQGLGRRTLVATKRQAPASEQAAASTASDQAGSSQQSASSRQASAGTSYQEGSQQAQQAQQAQQGKQAKQGKQREKKAGNTGEGAQGGGLASLVGLAKQDGDSGVVQQATQSLSVDNLAEQCDKAV